MGVVYRALDTRQDRMVAIKVLHANVLSNEERTRRFTEDARASTALNHPNIAAIYEIGSAGGIDFIAMELVPGSSLDHLLGGRALALGERLKCSIQVAEALGAAHAAGVVHRDLKPSNIMITEQGQAKVLDFAVSRLGELVPDDTAGATLSMLAPDAQRTKRGQILGAVGYLSPERVEGKPVDARSDIFSLGAVLYEMATGKRAFSGESRLATLTAILQTEPDPVRKACPGASRGIERIITRCLRKDPARRYQAMSELKTALEELLADVEAGRSSSGLGAIARWFRRS
jgi:serine/threonine protein kinase